MRSHFQMNITQKIGIKISPVKIITLSLKRHLDYIINNSIAFGSGSISHLGNYDVKLEKIYKIFQDENKHLIVAMNFKLTGYMPLGIPNILKNQVKMKAGQKLIKVLYENDKSLKIKNINNEYPLEPEETSIGENKRIIDRTPWDIILSVGLIKKTSET